MNNNLNVLSKVYKGLLAISPFVEKDDIISNSDSGEPWLIDGKIVAFPTEETLKNSDHYQIFHPLKENMLLGPRKVVIGFRDACVANMNNKVMPVFIKELYDLQQKMGDSKSLPMSMQAIVSGYPKLTRDDVKHMHAILKEFDCFDVSILMSNLGNPGCKVVTTFPLLQEIFSILEDKSNPPVVGNYKSSKSALVKYTEIMLKLFNLKEAKLILTTESSDDLEQMLDTKRLPSIVLVYLSIANLLMGDIQTLVLEENQVMEFIIALSGVTKDGHDLSSLTNLAASNDKISKPRKKKRKSKKRKRKSKKRKHRSRRRYRDHRHEERCDSPPWDVDTPPPPPNNSPYGKLSEEEIAMVNLGLITPDNIRSGKKPTLASAQNPQAALMPGMANAPMHGMQGGYQQPGFGILPSTNPMYQNPHSQQVSATTVIHGGYQQGVPMNGYPQQGYGHNPPPINGGYTQQAPMGYVQAPMTNPVNQGYNNWGNKYRR